MDNFIIGGLFFALGALLGFATAVVVNEKDPDLLSDLACIGKTKLTSAGKKVHSIVEEHKC